MTKKRPPPLQYLLKFNFFDWFFLKFFKAKKLKSALCILFYFIHPLWAVKFTLLLFTLLNFTPYFVN